MKTLYEMVGEEILINFAFLPLKNLETAKLHLVDDNGIWIESNNLTQAILENLNIPAGKTPIIFLPFAQVRYILGASDGISLMNKAYGV